MKYKYRWLYVISIGIGIAMESFAFVIYPEVKQIAQLHKEKKRLKQKIIVIRKELKRSKNNQVVSLPSNANPMEDLSHLLLLVHFNELFIQSVKFLNSKTVELVLSGDFQQFVALLRAFDGQFYLLDFSWQTKKSKQSVLGMTVLMSGRAFNQAKALSLSSFKMVGYLKQGLHKQVLLLSPTGEVVAVNQGVKE